jgi:Domain of unknown function (DUF4124)
MRQIAVILGALALSAAAYGQMYKWVDKGGKTHYTDTPPPSDARSVTPAPATGARDAPTKPAADPAGAAGRPGGKREGTQGSFRPEEEVALRTVCVIYLLETLTCQLNVQRYCPIDELVNGIGGNPKKGIAKDPRNDPNYEYRVEVRPDDVLISAIPKAPGLTGFFSDKNSGTRYNPNGTAGKGDKMIVGATSCPDFK